MRFYKDSKPMPHILLVRLCTIVAFPELPSTPQHKVYNSETNFRVSIRRQKHQMI